MGVYANPMVDDIKKFYRFGKNWLRIKEHFHDLTDFEKQILGTKAEDFLEHIEKDLSPAKSYKMAVLSSLIEKDASEAGWSVSEIAGDFKDFYLQNDLYLQDYTEMVKAESPAAFRLKKVEAKIKQMPLTYLSNSKEKFFRLDKEANRFYMKDPELNSWWNDPRYKEQIRDRVTYVIKKYFAGKFEEQIETQ